MNEELRKLLNTIIKEKGGSYKDYRLLMDKIGYHESKSDSKAIQKGGGPGRGKYQFEVGDNKGANTAVNRTYRYMKANGIKPPQWLNEAYKNKSTDASQLKDYQQDIMFLGNMMGHPKADFKNVIDGKESTVDFWSKYHWAGNKKDLPNRVKSFNESMTTYKEPKVEKQGSLLEYITGRTQEQLLEKSTSPQNQFTDGESLNGPGNGIKKPKVKKSVSEKDKQDVLKYIKKLNSEEPLELNKTANNISNVFGNLGEYMFNIKDKDLKISPYKPSISKEENVKYYTRDGMKQDVYNDLTSKRVRKSYNHNGQFLDIYEGLKSNGSDRKHNADNAFPHNQAGYKGQYNNGHGSLSGEFNLGRYRTDAGEDENGKYISFYDKYDWNGLTNNIGESRAINFYDRIYENQWNDFTKRTNNTYNAISQFSPEEKKEFGINKLDEGGQLNSNINKGEFNQFNVGGSHQSNPNGGIPMGVGQNGKMNTVEENETSYDFEDGKYIFSARLGLNKKIK